MANEQSTPIIAVQIRMAVAGLGWSLEELAGQAGVAVRTVEAAVRDGSVAAADLRKLRHALKAAGVEFVDGKARGATVYVRTDNRTRPAVAVSEGVEYGSPAFGLCGRWMGESALSWGALALGTLEGWGDFVRLTARTDQGTITPFYFSDPEKAVAFLAETLVEQRRNREPALPDGLDLVTRYLDLRNRCRASVTVTVTPGLPADPATPAAVSVLLKPAADLEDALPPHCYRRTPLGLEDAIDWLQEANMMAHLRDNRRAFDEADGAFIGRMIKSMGLPVSDKTDGQA